jgi:spoIIIJ-associated protein
MAERTTLEVIAPTVEQALAQGLAQLGLPATAVSIEVLDSGNKGLFGLGGRQVRVRLTVNDGTASPAATAGSAAAPSAAIVAPSRRATAARRNGKSGKTSSRAVSKAPTATPAEPRAVSQSSGPSAVASSLDDHDAILDTSEAIISKLLYHMGLEAQVSAHYGEPRDDRRPIMVDVRGSDLGILIGRHGETLDSFQYIAALMIGKETGQFVHLVVDVEGHRDRRERQLRQLARRMAEQVLKTGRKLTLEPMRPAERRIIHLELRDHPAVTTESVGEEPHRKVTIIPKE